MANKKSQATTLKGRKERAGAMGRIGKGRRLERWAVKGDMSALELEPLPVPLHSLSCTTSKVHCYFRKIFTSI